MENRKSRLDLDCGKFSIVDCRLSTGYSVIHFQQR